ncbi:MAG TPA: T9SS type A sorting domain-containing protein, partial [Saprospiraceae bacterium]|nr:T9SS type A sorting domain-containing protein [Saprospiraceae bacterium]
MKNLCLSLGLMCLTWSALHAQTDIYAQPINHTGINLRGGATNLGSLTIDFPTGGYVVVHFDGECYASIGDRIVLAASDNGNWGVNDGSIAVENSMSGFGRPFSHTRVYAVNPGQHTYYAVGQNSIETDGSGRADIYGTLTVEYYPDTGAASVKSNGFIFNGDVTNTTVVGQQTIHANGPGKVLIRFDGYITSSPADRIVLAASNTLNWSFDDGNVAVEAVNAGDVDENSFSHTRVYNVNSAGDYTYNALAQVYGKAGGNHMISVYGNLLVEYFPTSGPEKISFDGFSLPTINLNGQSTTLTSISIDAPEPGKVMAVLDGYLTADPGYDIVLAASDNGEWTENDGNVTLQALDLDQNRYSFSHTRVYSIGAGNHTFYAVGQIFGGSGSKTADLFGELTLRYIPSSATATSDLNSAAAEFDVYPNPTHGITHITCQNAIHPDKFIQVLNSDGRVLAEYPIKETNDIQLDLSAFAPDVYWINIG